jgi:NAD dependent epimerase/dehydratase
LEGILLQNKDVLVTGAAGFIGSHLVDALARGGARVRALVRYNAQASIGNLQWVSPDVMADVKVIHGDVNDGEFVKRLVEGCDCVFHLAALIAIPYSYLAPRSYVQTNVAGTLNILEAVRECKTPRLIHTSTSEVYGSALYVPMDEAHPLQAQSPYSATKIAADKLVESYVRSFGTPAVTVRPFNTFGPRQSARAVIPTVIGQALAGPEVIRLGATTPVRDFTYVSDTVDGFIAAADCDAAHGGCFNLGTGIGVSIGELAQAILDLMEVPARVEEDAQRIRPEGSEVDRLVSTHKAFHEASGWLPKIGLSEGLQRTVTFFREHPELLPRTGYVR